MVAPHPLGVSDFDVDEGADPRQALTTWLTSPDNQWFARSLANRMWAHFFGRGLVYCSGGLAQSLDAWPSGLGACSGGLEVWPEPWRLENIRNTYYTPRSVGDP